MNDTTTSSTKKQYISTKEAAEMAGISVAKVCQWCRINNSYGHCYKERGRWHILTESWLKHQNNPADKVTENEKAVERVEVSRPIAKAVIDTENTVEYIQPTRWYLDSAKHHNLNHVVSIANAKFEAAGLNIRITMSRARNWFYADDNKIWACKLGGKCLVNTERFMEFFKEDVRSCKTFTKN